MHASHTSCPYFSVLVFIHYHMRICFVYATGASPPGGGGGGGYSFKLLLKSGGYVPTILFRFLGYFGVGGHTVDDSSPALKNPWRRP